MKVFSIPARRDGPPPATAPVMPLEGLPAAAHSEPQSELARYAYGFTDQKPSWRFWAIQLAMLAFVIWTLATTPAPAAHCRAGQLWRIRLGECVGLHSRLAAEIWRSPRRIAYREVVPAPAPAPPPVEDDDRTWYIEITKLPPDEPDRSAGIEALKKALAK
jgi:hypothetical protein